MDWNSFDKGIYVVNVLGIIYDPATKKILIGRRENDPYIKELTWCFPGGRPTYEGDIEENLIDIIQDKTGLLTEAKGVIFAKTYPEDRKFLSVYYLCELKSGAEEARGSFKELRWIDPREATEYFTTSIHPKLIEYLNSL